MDHPRHLLEAAVVAAVVGVVRLDCLIHAATMSNHRHLMARVVVVVDEASDLLSE